MPRTEEQKKKDDNARKNDSELVKLTEAEAQAFAEALAADDQFDSSEFLQGLHQRLDSGDIDVHVMVVDYLNGAYPGVKITRKAIVNAIKAVKEGYMKQHDS